MEQLIHMTATYSNALLVAILPHVSDCAKKLDLSIIRPATVEHVQRFAPNPYKGHFSGAVWLTNGYWFHFDEGGYVDSFRVPKNFFYELEYALEHLTNYMGQTRMTTNEIVAFARKKLLNLGYPPEITHADTMPEWDGPSDLNSGGHIPYCKLRWAPVKDEDAPDYSEVKVLINTQEKTLLGFYLDFARTNRSKIGTPLKLDVETELESDFRKRTGVKLFIRSNAPPAMIQNKVSGEPKDKD
jgi:hypothetical protein